MTWKTIFDGDVLGDHIIVEWDEDDQDDREYPVRVTAIDKSLQVPIPPRVEPGSIIFPPAPSDSSSPCEFEYDSIDDMYKNFADESGRCPEFTDALEKAIFNY